MADEEGSRGAPAGYEHFPQTQPCLVNCHEGAEAEGGSEEGWGRERKRGCIN